MGVSIQLVLIPIINHIHGEVAATGNISAHTGIFGVIEPDRTLIVYRYTGNMGIATWRAGSRGHNIFGHPIAGTWRGLADHQLSDFPVRPFRPPDIAGCIIGNHVRSIGSARRRVGTILINGIILHGATGGGNEAANFGYAATVFRKPYRARGRIGAGNAIGPASGAWSRSFVELL